MADLSKFTIVTYERRPGQWRAAVTPVRRAGAAAQGATVLSVVTPDDCDSEAAAQAAAERIVKNL
jgi:hypothetical protein